MKKSILTAIISAIAITVFAAEVDFNGGFEKCTPDRAGVPQASFWNKTRTISKKAECRLVKEADCVKSGTFALLAETEEGGYFFFRSLKEMPVVEGDTVEMEIFVKGSGKYNLQYIVYGADDPKKQVFLTTMGTGRDLTAKEEEWTKCYRKFKFVPPAKAKGKFTKFTIIPVIIGKDNAELYFDDFSLKVNAPAPAAK